MINIKWIWDHSRQLGTVSILHKPYPFIVNAAEILAQSFTLSASSVQLNKIAAKSLTQTGPLRLSRLLGGAETR